MSSSCLHPSLVHGTAIYCQFLTFQYYFTVWRFHLLANVNYTLNLLYCSPGLLWPIQISILGIHASGIFPSCIPWTNWSIRSSFWKCGIILYSYFTGVTFLICFLEHVLLQALALTPCGSTSTQVSLWCLLGR